MKMVGLQWKNPLELDDDWGYPHDLGNLHVAPYVMK